MSSPAKRDEFVRRVRNIKVIDGDTFEAEVELGFGKVWEKVGRRKLPRFRLLGINAPETSRRGSWDNNMTETQVNAEIAKGEEAKRWLAEKLGAADEVYIQSPGWEVDNFGRVLVEVFVFDETQQGHVNATMLLLGLARPYKK